MVAVTDAGERTREARVRSAPGPTARRRWRDASFLLLVLGLGTLVVYLSPIRILEALTSRTALLIYIIMVAEYLFIKSTDRTRIYRLENQRLRDRRRDLEELTRDLGAAIDQAAPLVGNGEGAANEWQAVAEKLRQRLRNLM